MSTKVWSSHSRELPQSAIAESVSQQDREEARWSKAMVAAHRGDKQAYEQLLRELGNVTEQYIQRRFGRLACIEDCVQECLLAIHLARHTWDPRRPFKPWFFTIVHHKTVDVLRRSSYAPTHGRRSLHGSAAEPRAGGEPADELAPGDILNQLGAAHRDALMMTKIEGHSLAEAAALAGISEAAMKSRVARAIHATAVLLQRDGQRQ
jgi:RNA polymerase sigma-70 factor, ECF subfamily